MAWLFPKLPFTMPKLQLVDSGSAPDATPKTGEQLGKMTDPLGKRLYHEYFIGDDRGDGHFPWSCRIYCGADLAAEKTGLAASYLVARKQALDWAVKTRQAIGEQP